MLLPVILSACTKPLPVETLAVQPAPLAVARGDVARGEHLGTAILACTECHGPDLAGKELTSGFPVGRLVAPNLTLLDYDASDWVGAVRHGVAPDGRKLVLMPSDDYARLVQEDLADLVAWLETLEPTGEPMPESKLGPVGSMLVRKGSWPMTADRIDHDAPVPIRAEAAPAPLERGAYLATVSGCLGCHGGGPGKSMGPGLHAANLTPHQDGLAAWTRDDFVRAMRQGLRPDGSAIDPFMPWPYYAGMDDADLDALWSYLQTLPAQPDP